MAKLADRPGPRAPDFPVPQLVRRSLRACAVLAAIATLAPSLAAQGIPPARDPALAARRVPVASDSAATLPRGTFRLGFAGTHATARDRYVDGTLEGLGGPLTSAALGPSRFSLLGSIEAEVQGLGITSFAASLGASRLDARQRLFVTPLSIEYGLGDRLTIGVSSSLVRTRAEVHFRLDGAGATLGRNPIGSGSGVAASNDATVGAYATAWIALTSRRDNCTYDPLAFPECPTIIAEAADVDSLINRTYEFTNGIAFLYGTLIVSGSPYVPLAGSPAEDGLATRLDSLRTALERYGVTSITPTTGLPLGAQTPLSAEDLVALAQDPVAGFGAKPLEKGGLTALGDVHFTATYRVLDGLRCRGGGDCVTPSRGIRQAVRLDYALSTGARKRPDRLLDQGTGAGFDAISVRSLTDVAVNRWLSGSIALGVTTYVGDDVRMRVPSVPTANFLESWRTAIVAVSPGMRLDLGLTPSMRIGENVAVSLNWQWLQQLESSHAVDSLIQDPRDVYVTLTGGSLDAMSAWSEQRAGLSATYSMLPAIARGLRRLPIDISFTHAQTLFGHSGIVVKRWEDRVMIRYYTRLRGR
jgi:hypothetical protein